MPGNLNLSFSPSFFLDCLVQGEKLLRCGKGEEPGARAGAGRGAGSGAGCRDIIGYGECGEERKRMERRT